MTTQYFICFAFLVSSTMLVNWASAAAHGHDVNSIERESDGSYRAKDYDHYSDSGHNSEFDHEAILGSVKEAEEFDKLSPDEAKKRLGQLLEKMDKNHDLTIDKTELRDWILNSFIKLSREETEERLKEVDNNQDNLVTWEEYLQDSFGVDAEEEIDAEDTGDTGMLVREEKAMWKAADQNNDGKLDAEEFDVFTNPEEHEVMHPYLVNQTLREKDTNKDGYIDFNEYIGERGMQQDRSWLESEREKFNSDLDHDSDGKLNLHEIFAWVIPNNNELAEEEVEHLFQSADDDHDDILSYQEVLDHHDVFVGSEATDYGNDLLGAHFDDEL